MIKYQKIKKEGDGLGIKHLNLTVADVVAVREFFRKVFWFNL